MTQITAILARVARQCSVDAPSSWVTATSDEHVELRDDFLMEAVDEVRDRIDAPAPVSAQFVITGDGSGTYALPSNFRRLHRDGMAVYETTTVRRRLHPVTDDGMWTHLQTIGTTGGDRFYKIEGGNILLYREPASAISVTVSYVTQNWMKNAAGTAGSEFTAEDDEVLMPRRLIEAGMIWRFRERQGLPFAAKKAEFEAELSRYSNDARGRRKIDMAPMVGGRRPWDIPVPDEIPTGG